MSRPLALAAVDLGASSGRVMLGRVGSGPPARADRGHRFRNGPVRLPDGLYWDVLGLYLDVLDGLRTRPRRRSGAWPGSRSTPGRSTTGCSTGAARCWATRATTATPRTETVIDDVHRKLDPARLYAITGLQFLPFNTLYQLAAEPRLDARPAGAAGPRPARLLADRQCGRPSRPTPPPRACSTPAPATGRGRAGRGARPAGRAAAGRAARRARCWPGLTGPRCGPSSASTTSCRSPPSARTTPRRPSSGCRPTTSRFAYISCGTWGLVGVELDAPVLTEDSRAANFTNERGVDGTIRYLRNVMGLWLLSESLRAWNLRGLGRRPRRGARRRRGAAARRPAHRPGRPRVPAARRHARSGSPRAAGRCPTRTAPRSWCAASSTASPSPSPPRSTTPSGCPVSRSRSCTSSAAAPRTRCSASSPPTPPAVRCVAGPVEATALGNLLVQARTHGVLSGDLAALRERVRAVSRLQHYRPRT